MTEVETAPAKAPRRQLQPYKSELRTVFNRLCALVEKRTAEAGALRAELRDVKRDRRWWQAGYAVLAVAALIRWLA